MISILVMSLIGGFILNFMPCVLPVVSLKLNSLINQTTYNKKENLKLNLSYVAGLLIVFMGLATLASLTQFGLAASLSWGQLYTITAFKVFMTSLVFVMGLSFLEVWEIPIPGLSQHNKQNKTLGSFITGMLATLLATPCSGPFLGPIFALTLTQPVFFVYLIFFCIGLGMGLPYIIMAFYPKLLFFLPKPGVWMEIFKQILGFVLLATTIYLLNTITSIYTYPTLILLLLLSFGCWIIGKIPTYSEYYLKVLFLVVFSICMIIPFIFSPPKTNFMWEPYSPGLVAQHLDNNETVLVNFTANWCLSCQWNKLDVYQTNEFISFVQNNNLVCLEGDWTNENPEIKSELKNLGFDSIPLLAFYFPDGKIEVLPDLITLDQIKETIND